jgi:hypothetical protein
VNSTLRGFLHRSLPAPKFSKKAGPGFCHKNYPLFLTIFCQLRPRIPLDGNPLGEVRDGGGVAPFRWACDSPTARGHPDGTRKPKVEIAKSQVLDTQGFTARADLGLGHIFVRIGVRFPVRAWGWGSYRSRACARSAFSELRRSYMLHIA